ALGRCGDCPGDVDLDLLDRLRRWRVRVGMEQGLPPYLVLTDTSLSVIAEIRPRDLDELSRVPGVGATKLELYGKSLMGLLADCCEVAHGSAAVTAVVEGQRVLTDRLRIERDDPADRVEPRPQQAMAEKLDGMSRAEDACQGIGQRLPVAESTQPRVLIEPTGVSVLPVQTGADRACSPPGPDESRDFDDGLAEDHLNVVDLPVAEPCRRMEIGDQVGARDDQWGGHEVEVLDLSSTGDGETGRGEVSLGDRSQRTGDEDGAGGQR